MNSIKSFLSRYWPIITILGLEIMLFVQNYVPGTNLIGWDNTYSDLNLLLNLKRGLFAIWQEYRGLGLLDGMSFAAYLPHTLTVMFFSLFLPENMNRYAYVFMTHLMGGWGIYLLINYLLEGKKLGRMFSFIGCLFYLYNLAVLQIFFVPHEIFTAHFGFMPWLIYFILKFLDVGEKKYLVWFTVFSIMSTPQAHVPTIFIVYMMAVLTIFGFKVLNMKKMALKRSIVLLVIIFFINSFWGLPYLYATVKRSDVIANSKINLMSTENIYLRNKAFGDFADVALMRGITINFVDIQGEEIGYMMSSWREFAQTPFFMVIGFSFFAVALLGMITSFIHRSKQLYPFSTIFIFSFLMLGTDIPVLNIVSGFCYKYIPYFFQIFRYTFTKFSIIYALSYSIMFAYGLCIIYEKFKVLKKFKALVFTLLIFSLAIYSWFSWEGEYINKYMRLDLPEEYKQLVDYFKNQNSSDRIALLPQPSYWGWTYTKWGYRGSGFIWYGLPQASLDGAFYPWSRENESYFWEMSNAIYSTNTILFQNVLDKYQIKWIVIDESIISNSSLRSIYLDKLKDLVNKLDKVHLAANFGKNKVYKVDLDTAPKDFVFLADDLPSIGPEYKWNNYDKAYLDIGTYISTTNYPPPTTNNTDIYYPFRSLFTGRQQSELEFGVEVLPDYFSFKAKIPKELARLQAPGAPATGGQVGYKLDIPALYENEGIELDANDLSKKAEKIPQVYLDGELVDATSFWGAGATPESDSGQARMTGGMVNLPYIKEGNFEVRVPKINGYYSSNYQPLTTNQSPKSCDNFNIGIGLYKHENVTYGSGDLLRLTSIGSSNCLDFSLPNLSQDIGYLVTVESRNIEGKSMLFSIINKNSQRADIETYLPKKLPTTNHQLITSYFILPPMEKYGLGYTIHLDNISIGRVKTVNDLGKITVNPIPYRLLTGLKIVKDFNYPLPTTNYQPISVSHPNPSLYTVILNSSTPGESSGATPGVSLPQSNNTTLVLSQSFDSGWKAYSINDHQSSILNSLFPFWTGKEIKDHVMVNNWENGWQLSNETMKQCSDGQCNIIIVYLPQYLEYIGFILLGVGLLVVIFYPKTSFNKQSPIIN